MSKLHSAGGKRRYGWLLIVVLCLAWARVVPAQQSPVFASSKGQTQASSGGQEKSSITPEQTKQLFSLVDDLLKFSSQETGLTIQGEVKREITTRAKVESYLAEKFAEDESAKRMERGEIVLKKFGLLDRDFDLKPFLLALLKEQIEAYYDSKTKTVFMLDWVSIEEQKPVLAHELTHALQDQRVDLEKWNDQTPDDIPLNSSQDSDHLAKDEMDTAREAVVEGQATPVMMYYILKPLGKSLIKDPEVMELAKQQMASSESSPVLSRAPLLLSESLLFPYREGLSFEQGLWMDQGQVAAFAGAMDRPPTSTWEIVNPREYERKSAPSIPLLPNIHPLVDKLYKPYDIGQIGLLDLRILTEILAGESAASALSSAWDGGLYWAGQLRSAQTSQAQSKTDSLALFYLSAWKNNASAQAFAKYYANNLGRKYSGLKPYPVSASAASTNTSGDLETIFTTSEGPVLIVVRGKLVFVAESFDLELAHKLATLVLDGQSTGDLEETQLLRRSVGAPEPALSLSKGLDFETWDPNASHTLSGGLVHFFSSNGVMKAAVEAGMKAAVR